MVSFTLTWMAWVSMMSKRVLHLEPTSRCQLSCPSCPRTKFLDLIPIRDVSIDLVLRNLDGYDEVYMCGNHGDAIYHPQFHELLAGIKDRHPGVIIQFETNGSGRNAAWWQSTASYLGKRDCVVFSVDGLRDTNHIYRIGSKWESIETGMRTLRDSNPAVKMHWKWIVFHHNQDQVKHAYWLSKDIGFNKFTAVRSDRDKGDHWLNPTRDMDDIMQDIHD